MGTPVESLTFQNSWRPRTRGDESYSKTVEIPTTFIGHLIGAKGKSIKLIENDTKARLQISKNQLEERTEVKIFGSPQAVENAKTRINVLLENNQQQAFNKRNSDNRKVPAPAEDWSEPTETTSNENDPKFKQSKENINKRPTNINDPVENVIDWIEPKTRERDFEKNCENEDPIEVSGDWAEYVERIENTALGLQQENETHQQSKNAKPKADDYGGESKGSNKVGEKDPQLTTSVKQSNGNKNTRDRFYDANCTSKSTDKRTRNRSEMYSESTNNLGQVDNKRSKSLDKEPNKFSESTDQIKPKSVIVDQKSSISDVTEKTSNIRRSKKKRSLPPRFSTSTDDAGRTEVREQAANNVANSGNLIPQLSSCTKDSVQGAAKNKDDCSRNRNDQPDKCSTSSDDVKKSTRGRRDRRSRNRNDELNKISTPTDDVILNDETAKVPPNITDAEQISEIRDNARKSDGAEQKSKNQRNRFSRPVDNAKQRGNTGMKESQEYHRQTTPVGSQSTLKVNEAEAFDFDAIAKECDMLSEKYWAKFPPVIKCFYEELPEVKNMTPQAVAKFRDDHNNIMAERPLEGKTKMVPNPVATFYQAFHNYPEILELIKKAGFEHPSPIQCQAWPILLSGEDLIGIAQTGTGKTLAFLLPALIHIDNQQELRKNWVGPIALVLAPTRELAIQIEKETNKYHYKGIKAVCVYGGANRQEQIRKMKDGADIVIATPGRLDDLVLAGHVNPDTITYVVLDEADRMLDMGFEPQIRKTLYKVRPNRQTVMTSATWPSGVRRLAQSYMQHPVQVCVGSLDLVAVHSVKQTIVIMENEDDLKFEHFIKFIKNLTPNEKVLVFAGKKAKASLLSTELTCMGIDCSCIHGDMEQSDREQAITDMMDNTSRLLIATDVVSRGIDIEDVTHVVNYDFPRNIEEYVHRVGRTGRAGKTGEAISFFTWSDARHVDGLIGILEEANQEIPRGLKSMAERYARGAARREAQNRNKRY